jgi:malate/lactate dehydrogenase
MKKFYYYKLGNKYFFSKYLFNELKIILEEQIKNSNDILYFLDKRNPISSRRGYLISSPSMLYLDSEGLNLLEVSKEEYDIPDWIKFKISNKLVKGINTSYPNWEDELLPLPEKWRINLFALGDVGSTLLIGLRLLGGNAIDEIGIYDRNKDRLNRWLYEVNQIRKPFDESSYPIVKEIKEDNLFDCDIFVFCASKGIPPVGSEIRDVRMAQFEANSEIVTQYARIAREKNFKGIFAVVSDPVDLLCKVAFLESNKDKDGSLDFKGLASNQIIGYGLGVMNARAAFYAEKSPSTLHYLKEGRVFGPHGEGLIVANSIYNYNVELSKHLTERTINANLEIRAFGAKPYVAPSLSSGALSIIATVRGEYFYGSTYMGKVFMGSKYVLNP